MKLYSLKISDSYKVVNSNWNAGAYLYVKEPNYDSFGPAFPDFRQTTVASEADFFCSSTEAVKCIKKYNHVCLPIDIVEWSVQDNKKYEPSYKTYKEEMGFD